MSWRVSVSFIVAASAGVLSAIAAPARADEAYLCGPDKVVYVAVADLERMKRTDACIAGYYGLKVEEPAKQATAAAPPAAKPKPVVQAELKPLTESEVFERSAAAKPMRQAALAPPHALPGTDFRNVKILNAASPDGSWFHHKR